LTLLEQVTGTKVYNKNECGYNSISTLFGNFYGSRWFISERLYVRHIQVISDNAAASDRAGAYPSMRALIRILTLKKPTVDLDMDIYLIDGRVIEVRTKDKRIMKAALPYMQVNDPREAYRLARKQNGGAMPQSGGQIYWPEKQPSVKIKHTGTQPPWIEEIREQIRRTGKIEREQYQALIDLWGTDTTKWQL